MFTGEWIRTALLIVTVVGSVGTLGITIGSFTNEVKSYNETTRDLAVAVDKLGDRVDVQTNTDSVQDARLDHHWDAIQMLRRAHNLE